MQRWDCEARITAAKWIGPHPGVQADACEVSFSDFLNENGLVTLMSETVLHITCPRLRPSDQPAFESEKLIFSK